MLKRIGFPFVIMLLIIACKDKPKSPARTIYNDDFKWTITIPAGFDTVSAAAWAKMQQRGTDAIEKTYGTEIENNTKTIFVFRSDNTNYLESNYQAYDTAKDGDYSENFKLVSEVIYNTFLSQMQGATLDSASSTEVIDGLSFKKFSVLISLPNNLKLNTKIYSRLFGNKDLTVSMITSNDAMEKELMKAWLNSRFEK